MMFRHWRETINAAAKQSNLKWWQWRTVGSRDPIEANFTWMKEAKRCLRREQRREAATRRDQKIEKIMAAENDPKTFFRLIKHQRKIPDTQTNCLVVNGERCDTLEAICQEWSTYSQKLVLPLEKERFDSEYKELCI